MVTETIPSSQDLAEFACFKEKTFCLIEMLYV